MQALMESPAGATIPAPVPPARFNFASHVFDLNRRRAHRLAYIDDDGTLTYGELEERARRFASAMRALGIRTEERILLVMLDTVELPIAFLGALYAGVVPVVANTLLAPGDYAYMITHSRARAVIASASLMPAVVSALEQAAPGSCALIASGADSSRESTPLILQQLLDTAVPISAPIRSSRDDIAFWLYSSGSTGRPKGTVHTHANLYWTAELYGKPILGITEHDVVFSAAKLFFAYGLGNALTFPLSVGATAVLMTERPSADAVFSRLVQHRPTIFFGVPTLYANMLASARLPAREDVSLRICTSAGEMLPKEIGERFSAHFGCDVLDGIGSTEMLHIFLSNRPGQIEYGTTGTPVPGYEVDLRDETGASVTDGEIGDLFIKGPSAALMYWCNRERSRTTFLGDWVRSGDKCRRLPNGRYVYAGRSDDMLKVSGQYVSPLELETVLMQHDAVLEAAVVGVERHGLAKTRAFVVLKPHVSASDALANEIKAFIKQWLAPHKSPREIVFVDELPRTTTGKIQRFKLREQS